MAITISHIPKALWPVIGGSVKEDFKPGDIVVLPNIHGYMWLVTAEGWLNLSTMKMQNTGLSSAERLCNIGGKNAYALLKTEAAKTQLTESLIDYALKHLDERGTEI